MPEIRLAAEDDLDEIWALVGRAVKHMNASGNSQWGEDYPTREFYAEDIARGELYVAITNIAHATVEHASIIGVACINTDQAPEYVPIPWEISGPAMVIHRMAVDPDVQRQGVASSLFAFTEELARMQGIPAVHMDTYAQNDRMQALVIGRGYRKTGEVSFGRDARPLMYPCFEKVLEP